MTDLRILNRKTHKRWCSRRSLCAAGLEEKITPDLAIDFIAPYQPLTFGFKGYAPGVKPEVLAGFESPIMPKRE